MVQTAKEELKLEAKVENLSLVNDFLERLLLPLNCSVKTQMQLELVVEEIFVNIANYAYGDKIGQAKVQGQVMKNPLRLELTFIDEGKPYNPLEREEPDLNQKMEERAIGGLGIFLVKKNVDELHYHYEAGQNILTLCKHIT